MKNADLRKAKEIPTKWYNKGRTPILPQLSISKGNEYNTRGFTFTWLFIKIWTLDAVGFELAIVCDTHWGIGVTAIIPYLRIVCCIPLPAKLEMWAQHKLWRHPKQDN